MTIIYVIEFIIHAFYSPDVDAFNGLKYVPTPLGMEI
jgi:hypothetical protein